MAQRTRTIQRTPNVGLTLKMQSLQEAAPCEPCVPAPESIRWYNEETEEWDTETIVRSTNANPHTKRVLLQSVGDTEPDSTCQWSREMYVARVLGPLCDEPVLWEWQWDETGEVGWEGSGWYIQPAGSAIAAHLVIPPYDGHRAGVLTITATVAGVTLAPIYFVVLDPVYCC
jgi:hypothetical protein